MNSTALQVSAGVTGKAQFLTFKGQLAKEGTDLRDLLNDALFTTFYEYFHFLSY